MLLTSRQCEPALRASCVLARFSSSRVMANQRSEECLFRCSSRSNSWYCKDCPRPARERRTRQFSAMAWPCSTKIFPLIPSRSLRSIPALPRHAPNEQRPIHAPETLRGSAVATDLIQQWKRAIVQFHHDTLQRLESRRDFDQMQFDWLIRAKQAARGDSGKQGVSDLAGRAGDSDFYGRFHRGFEYLQ